MCDTQLLRRAPLVGCKKRMDKNKETNRPNSNWSKIGAAAMQLFCLAFEFSIFELFLFHCRMQRSMCNVHLYYVYQKIFRLSAFLFILCVCVFLYYMLMISIHKSCVQLNIPDRKHVARRIFSHQKEILLRSHYLNVRDNCHINMRRSLASLAKYIFDLNLCHPNYSCIFMIHSTFSLATLNTEIVLFSFYFILTTISIQNTRTYIVCIVHSH